MALYIFPDEVLDTIEFDGFICMAAMIRSRFWGDVEADHHCTPLGENEKTLVGSTASGMFIQDESDVDYMIVPTGIKIKESGLLYMEDSPCYLHIPNESLDEGIQRVLAGKDGFVEADRIRSFDKNIFGSFEWPFQEKRYSKVGKVLMGEVIVDGVRMRGPIDYVPQLKLSGVPRPAVEFVDRQRVWPSRGVISSILAEGFHITARPSPIYPDPDRDFCLSFAKAEVKLGKAMDSKQKASIIKMKRVNCNFMDRMLTSYMLKTAACWVFEQIDPGVLDRANVDQLTVAILAKLGLFISSGHMPHYFVPTMNLMHELNSYSDYDVLCRCAISKIMLWLPVDDAAHLSRDEIQDKHFDSPHWYMDADRTTRSQYDSRVKLEYIC